jgi:hypothetical protein
MVNADDDYLSTTSLPEKISQQHNYYTNLYYSTGSEVDEWSVSVASAPAILECNPNNARKNSSFFSQSWPRGQTSDALLHPQRLNKDDAAHELDGTKLTSQRLSKDCNNDASVISDFFYTKPTIKINAAIKMGVDPPSPGSDYTSFVNLSFSSPHRHCASIATHDTDLYRPNPTIHLTPRTCATIAPSEEGEEHTVEDYEEYLDSLASSGEGFSDFDDEDDIDDDGDDVYSHFSVGKIRSWSDDGLLQPDLLLDPPSGIMLVFDRMLDCIDPPPNSGIHGSGEDFHRWPSSSPPLHYRDIMTDFDDRSILTADTLLLGDSESFPHIVANHHFSSHSEEWSQRDLNEDIQWLLPCWDEDSKGSPLPRSATEQTTRKKKKKERKKRPRGRTRKRSISPDLKLFETEDEELVATMDTFSSDATAGHYHQTLSSPSLRRPLPLLSPLDVKNEVESQGLYISDSSHDGNDDDSLCKILKGLDFEPPYDENNESCHLNRTATTDGTSTLSYSRVTN